MLSLQDFLPLPLALSCLRETLCLWYSSTGAHETDLAWLAVRVSRIALLCPLLACPTLTHPILALTSIMFHNVLPAAEPAFPLPGCQPSLTPEQLLTLDQPAVQGHEEMA